LSGAQFVQADVATAEGVVILAATALEIARRNRRNH